MNKDEIFLIEESVLIDDLVKLCYQQSLIKNASLYDEIGLSSIGSSIINHFKSAFHYGEDVPGGLSVKILNVLSPSILFRISPFLGGIYLLASSVFGMDLVEIIKSIVSKFSSKIDNKEPISPSEIQQIVSGTDVTAYKKDLSLLIKTAYQEQLIVKNSKRRSWDRDGEKFDFPWMATDRKLGLMQKLFGNLSALRGKRLIFGLAMWVVKNIFLGLGLLAVGGTAAKLLGVKKQEKVNTENEEPEVVQESEPQVQPQQIVKSTKKDAWMVPLVGNMTVEDTLRIWALDLYPELDKNPEIDSIIFKSNKFRELVRYLKSDYKKISSRFLIMPDEFRTRKQVVDKFIDDIKRDAK